MQECIPGYTIPPYDPSILPYSLISTILKNVGKYFDDLELLTTCYYTCANCASVQNQCLTCYSQLKRYLSGTNCLCYATYYDDGKNSACQGICKGVFIVCSSKCSNCSDANTCTSCETLYQRTLNGTICGCNPGFFENSTNVCTCNSGYF